MRKDVILITNNSEFQQKIDSRRLKFLNGTSLDVLISARDAIHAGSVMLTHPLYGNLRPNQQPFRSVLLQAPRTLSHSEKETNISDAYDPESISKIEDALLLYQSYGERLVIPGTLSAAMRDDYAFVDFELMRESLRLYGLVSR